MKFGLLCIKFVWIPAILAFLSTTSAIAAPQVFPAFPGKGYIRFGGGISMPASALKVPPASKPEANNEWIGILPHSSAMTVSGLGYDLNNGLNIELTFENRKYSINYELDPFDATTTKQEVSALFKNRTVRGNVYYDIDLRNRVFVPYLGIGLGASFNGVSSFNKKYSQTVQDRLGNVVGPVPSSTKYDDFVSQSLLSWSATLGGNFKITPRLSINLSYLFNDIGPFQSAKSGTVTRPDATVSGAPSRSLVEDLDLIEAQANNHELIIGVRYMF